MLPLAEHGLYSFPALDFPRDRVSGVCRLGTPGSFLGGEFDPTGVGRGDVGSLYELQVFKCGYTRDTRTDGSHFGSGYELSYYLRHDAASFQPRGSSKGYVPSRGLR